METLDRIAPLDAPYAHAHFLPSYGAVSYTHLDVYKRQGFSQDSADKIIDQLPDLLELA